MGAPPLHVTLTKLAAESREKIAAELLAPDAVRDACSKAACQGLNVATIILGPANLEHTQAATALRQAFKGLSFEWVEGVTRDGAPEWSLRVLWGLSSAPAPDRVHTPDHHRDPGAPAPRR